MKLDAKIHPISYKPGLPTKDFTIAVDEDYVSDYDDLIEDVEDKIYAKYGCSAFVDLDFTITNDKELCEALFNSSED